MKTFIAAILIVVANSAAATGFSPWSDLTGNEEQQTEKSVAVDATGFGPWRDRVVVDGIHIQADRGIANGNNGTRFFSPWS